MDPVALITDNPRWTLALLVAGYALPPFTAALAEGLRVAGKDKTWWGAALLRLCLDVGGAARDARLRRSPPPGAES